MTGTNILDTIKLYFPSALSDAQIRTAMNTAQTKYYTAFQTIKKTTIALTKDEEIYKITSVCKFDDILKIEITNDTVITDNSSFQEYTKYKTRTANKQLSGYQCYDLYNDGTDNNIGIYPIPTITDSNMVITHRSLPTSFTVENTSSEVSWLKSDYHMIIVYGAICEMCMISKDTELFGMYNIKLNEMLDEAKLSKAKDDAQYVKIAAMKWW